MKKIILVLTLAMASASVFAGVYDNVSMIFPALSMGAGARAMGMGGAYTAVADDASAIYWNAAGLGTIKNIQAVLNYDKWFVDTMFSRGMFAVPLSAGAIGADIFYMSMGSITGRDIYGAATGNIYPYSIGGSAGYGISFGDISAGAALKIISQSTGARSNTAFAGDAGVLYKTGIYSAGLTLQNIGGTDGYSLPTVIKAGAAIKPINEGPHRLLIAVDAQYLFKDSASVSAGAEYVYADMLAARIGYKTGFARTNLEGLKGLSGGIGVKYAGVSFDYALVTYGDLGISHMITLTYDFAGYTQPKPAGVFKAEPYMPSSAAISVPASAKARDK
jgi:hypothetical protein